jgi:rhodanese-related sulfurtransferase
MHDGDTLAFPGMRLEILETPGHTIESISILVFDLASSAAQPYAVLTGDTLFIGDVGRPDLRASLGFSAEELGSHLYNSLHTKLLPLPDDTLVYPAHGAGSLCGKNISSDTVSPLGIQRRFNYALQPMSKDEFIALVTADQPDAPQYFTYDAVLNTRERETLDTNLVKALQPLSLDQVLQLRDDGAQLLDVRDAADFALGHLRGSLNIGLGGQYATWAGTLLDRERPIVLLAEPGREPEAALRLGRIGFDDVRGFLSNGLAVLASRPDLIATTARIDPITFSEELSTGSPPLVLDVRTAREYASAHILHSLNIPLNHLQARLSELPDNRPIAVHCAGGYRSSAAASILAQRGFTQLTELAGGLTAWQSARLPLKIDN